MSKLNTYFFIILILVASIYSLKKGLKKITQTASYPWSCNSCTLTQFTVTCNCQTANGNWVSSSINLNTVFGNNNGNLTRGPNYFTTCGSCSVLPSTDGISFSILSCICKQTSKSDFKDTTTSISLENSIYNKNGQLTPA